MNFSFSSSLFVIVFFMILVSCSTSRQMTAAFESVQLHEAVSNREQRSSELAHALEQFAFCADSVVITSTERNGDADGLGTQVSSPAAKRTPSAIDPNTAATLGGSNNGGSQPVKPAFPASSGYRSPNLRVVIHNPKTKRTTSIDTDRQTQTNNRDSLADSALINAQKGERRHVEGVARPMNGTAVGIVMTIAVAGLIAFLIWLSLKRR